MGDFMHRKQGLVLLASSVLSVVGVLLCIWRMMYWEQAAAVSVTEGSAGWTYVTLFGSVGLYAATVALLIGTTVLAARWWNRSA